MLPANTELKRRLLLVERGPSGNCNVTLGGLNSQAEQKDR